jgi:hypothetical protein
MTQARPIIFLAFANDRSDGVGYLRNLPDEARRVDAALEPVRGAGLSEVVMRQNATLDDSLAVFRSCNRIALWHYAGGARPESAGSEGATLDQRLVVYYR